MLKNFVFTVVFVFIMSCSAYAVEKEPTLQEIQESLVEYTIEACTNMPGNCEQASLNAYINKITGFMEIAYSKCRNDITCQNTINDVNAAAGILTQKSAEAALAITDKTSSVARNEKTFHIKIEILSAYLAVAYRLAH
jgi:lipoprotein